MFLYVIFSDEILRDFGGESLVSVAIMFTNCSKHRWGLAGVMVQGLVKARVLVQGRGVDQTEIPVTEPPQQYLSCSRILVTWNLVFEYYDWVLNIIDLYIQCVSTIPVILFNAQSVPNLTSGALKSAVVILTLPSIWVLLCFLEQGSPSSFPIPDLESVKSGLVVCE